MHLEQIETMADDQSPDLRPTDSSSRVDSRALNQHQQTQHYLDRIDSSLHTANDVLAAIKSNLDKLDHSVAEIRFRLNAAAPEDASRAERSLSEAGSLRKYGPSNTEEPPD